MDNEDIKKEKIKKILIIFSLCLVSFLFGNIFSYYLNPKCGKFDEKTKYVLNAFKSYQKDEEPIQITQPPIECNCPECVEIPVEKDTCPIKVDVSGAVRKPGVYCFKEGSVIQDAVDISKGFDTAYGYKYISRKINLAYELKDNQKIYFPFKDDLLCELQSFSPEIEKEIVITQKTEGIVENVSSSTEKEEETEGNSSEDTSCISINTATKDQLIELNGVGEATAKKIIDARPFAKIEDILNVSGIGDATFEKFKDDICL